MDDFERERLEGLVELCRLSIKSVNIFPVNKLHYTVCIWLAP